MSSRSLCRTLIASLAIALPMGTHADDQTVVRERFFNLSLPGKWTGSYDRGSDSWQYQSADGREAVTVGILHRAAGPAFDAIKADFAAYLQTRRKSEIKLGGPRLQLGEPEIQERRDAVLARYSGFDPGKNRRTFTRVIVNQLAAASFFYEAAGFTAEAFDARAKVVLGQIGLIGK